MDKKNKINNKDIDLIRDAALSLEENNLELAQRLMKLAHHARPNGMFIKNKLSQYEKNLDIKYKKKINELVKSGKVTIIPIGFRCYTKDWIKNNLGVTQESQPFDVGFFSPYAVSSILESQDFFKHGYSSHSVCIKNEEYHDKTKGKGIHFKTTTYEDIDKKIESTKSNSLHKFLDSTYGYYTLDNHHKFVLAHYNWHKFASHNKSNGVSHPKENLPKIKKLLSRRFSRMKEKIEKSQLVVFIYMNKKDNNYIKIDDDYYYLNNLEIIKKSFTRSFEKELILVDVSEENEIDPKTLIDLLINKTK